MITTMLPYINNPNTISKMGSVCLGRVWEGFLEVACTATGGGEEFEEGAWLLGGEEAQEGAWLLGGEEGAERLDCQVWPASTLLQQLFHCHSMSPVSWDHCNLRWDLHINPLRTWYSPSVP